MNREEDMSLDDVCRDLLAKAAAYEIAFQVVAKALEAAKPGLLQSV